MDYGVFIAEFAKLVSFCFPFSLIFGVTAKLYKLAIDFIFNRRIEI